MDPISIIQLVNAAITTATAGISLFNQIRAELAANGADPAVIAQLEDMAQTAAQGAIKLIETWQPVDPPAAK